MIGTTDAILIWLPTLQTFNSFVQPVFPQHWQTIRLTDLSLIMEVHQNDGLRELRLLFFPTVDDLKGTALRRGNLALPLDFMAERIPLPHMQSFKIENAYYDTRRPEFLQALPAPAYTAAYTALAQNRAMQCDSWERWAKLAKNVSDPLKKILKQVAFWYYPLWTYPSAASAAMRSFSWTTELK